MNMLCLPRMWLEFFNPFFGIPKPSAHDPVGIMHSHQLQHKDYRRGKVSDIDYLIVFGTWQQVEAAAEHFVL